MTDPDLSARLVASAWANAGSFGGSPQDVLDVSPTDEVTLSAVGIPSIDAARRATRSALRSPGLQLRRTADLLRREPGLTAPGSWRTLGQRAVTGAALEQLAQSGPVGAEVVGLMGAVAALLPADLRAEVQATKPWSPLGDATVRSRVAEAFGPGVVQVDAEPLGAATVTQLHQGTDREGRSLLVVITRPRVGRAVRDDAQSLAPLSALLDAALPVVLPAPARALSLPLLESLTRQLLARCDQRRVAADALELGLAVEAREVSGLVVARPIPGLVTRAAAAYEIPDGFDLARIDHPVPNNASLVQGLLGVTLESALGLGVHAAALNPAHLQVADDGTLVLIGGATAGRFSATSRKALVGAGMALLGGNPSGVVDGMVAMGIFPETADKAAIEALMADAGLLNAGALMGGSSADPGALRKTAIALLTRHEARVTPELMSFVLAMVQMGRTLRAFAPDIGVTELGMHALPRLMGLLSSAQDE